MLKIIKNDNGLMPSQFITHNLGSYLKRVILLCVCDDRNDKKKKAQ
jgi:hypothetical protein